MANVPVQVMANTNVKVPLDLKLQLRALWYSDDIYLSISDVLNDFFMYRIEKILVYRFFSNNNYFFSTSTPTKNKWDDVIPVTHF